MVFRKPYAFLIKNFRKIHIFLLLLSAFIYYKTLQVNTLLNEVLQYLSYDAYLEPISKYVSILFFITIFLMIGILLSLVILLRRKEKPWKIYLIPIISYLITLITFILIKNYFNNFDITTVKRTISTYGGLLFVGRIPQYATFVILFIRITGLDINKFGFKNDKEFLELEQDDREEFEVSINIDKYAFKRTYKKVIRVLGYFYEEHKFFMNIVFLLIAVFLLYKSVTFFLNHKTVTEENVLNANNYSIKVNKSYYTDKDMQGNIIEEKSGFVIINVTIKNNDVRRNMEMSNFHLVNGKNDYEFTNDTYSNNFTDLGKVYNDRIYTKGEERTFALIFKVDKKLDVDRYVLYYREYKSFNNVYLRKLKINVNDISSSKSNKEKKLGEELEIKYVNQDSKTFTFEKTEFVDDIEYNIESCDVDNDCSVTTKNSTTSPNYKILKIEFSSSDYEGKELIDFSSKYGKIKYVDNDKMTRSINIEDQLVNKEYLGNYLYIKVPDNIEQASKITFIYTVRNEKYLYRIR